MTNTLLEMTTSKARAMFTPRGGVDGLLSSRMSFAAILNEGASWGNKMQMKKPHPTNMKLYRAEAQARIARKVLSGEAEMPDGVGKFDYVLYLISHAIEDLAAGLQDEPDK